MSNMFVDKATVTVSAGKGGNGAVSFHREKYVTAGGPDGGNGGRGGNIVIKVDSNMSTLMDFRYRRKFKADDGANGSRKNCTGKDGADLTIRVPDGTIIRDKETDTVIIDMSSTHTFVLAKGGSGGWGNKHFATPTRQAPRFAKAGLSGEEFEVVLELKLIADVGLAGYPNVGKSTLLSVVSKAHPKIANYHFTTLFPNLGVVYVDEDYSFVMADIPGIIEGASKGAGLGHDFLRHIDRCRVLIHVVDISGSEGRDPISDFETINKELVDYSPELAKRPQIVVANKSDIAFDSEQTDSFKDYVEKLGLKLFIISAATNKGVRELVYHVANELKKLPPVKVYESDYVPRLKSKSGPDDIVIEKHGDVWSLEGEWLERLIQNTNFTDYESRLHFDKVLRNANLYNRMEDMGMVEGDTISIYNLEFEYVL
jgi:GTP-binding protein